MSATSQTPGKEPTQAHKSLDSGEKAAAGDVQSVFRPDDEVSGILPAAAAFLNLRVWVRLQVL